MILGPSKLFMQERDVGPTAVASDNTLITSSFVDRSY
jgi:hypothetical protein